MNAASTILVLGALVVPGAVVAQVPPASMRSGADSTRVTTDEGPTDKTVFTVPAGHVFVLTDFESNDDRSFEICDDGTRVRARVPNHSIRGNYSFAGHRPELHLNTGIVFAGGHQVVIRTWGVLGSRIYFDWSGYLAPADSAGITGTPGR